MSKQKYLSATVSVPEFTEHYILSVAPFFSNSDIQDTLETMGVHDISSYYLELSQTQEIDEETDELQEKLEGSELVVDWEPITEDTFEGYMLDFTHVIDRLNVSSLMFPSDQISAAYKVCDKEQSGLPQYVVGSISCAGGYDVDNYGIVDKDHPREKVYRELRQKGLEFLSAQDELTAYTFSTGLFSIESMTSVEYNYAIDKRNSILG